MSNNKQPLSSRGYRRALLLAACAMSFASAWQTVRADVPPPIPCDPGPCRRPGPPPSPLDTKPNARTRLVAIKTADGHFLTAVEGGGFSGPNGDPNSVALHADARSAGAWERFQWIWLDDAHTKFALKTMKGTYVSAVKGGGLGGSNDGSTPFHTDATRLDQDEVFMVDFDPDGKVTLRTRKGYYVGAVNGGGRGGPNTAPVHSDATTVGAWEIFTAVSVPSTAN
jgi:hypothetical protein